MTISKMSISNKLRIYRAEAKLSQQEVADALKISKSKYCRMEKGDTIPDLRELDALLVLFIVSNEEMSNTSFPITHTIKYPIKLLEQLEKAIEENSDVSENWGENSLRFIRLKEALEPVLDIRNKAMDFPTLDLSTMEHGTTVKRVHLDVKGEYLIDRCMKV